MQLNLMKCGSNAFVPSDKMLRPRTALADIDEEFLAALAALYLPLVVTQLPPLDNLDTKSDL